MPRAPRLGAVAAVLAGSVLLSRVLGYVREAVLARELGASAATDAYYAAFQIPDLLNYFLAGGALSIAFVPYYSRVLAQRRRRRGRAAARQGDGHDGRPHGGGDRPALVAGRGAGRAPVPALRARDAGAHGAAHAHRAPGPDLLHHGRHPARGPDGAGPLRDPGPRAAALQRRDHHRRARVRGPASAPRASRGERWSAPRSAPSEWRGSTPSSACACAPGSASRPFDAQVRALPGDRRPA